MTSAFRKLELTVHVTVSVGWLGAVMAYLALAVCGLSGEDDRMVRSTYLVMEWIGWYAIVPSSLAALGSGLIRALRSEWGILRHYWIVAKLALTIVGVIVLLVHMRAVSQMAMLAAAAAPLGDFDKLRTQLVVHPAGGLVVLLMATALSIYKPWGRTWLGRRKTPASAPT